MKRKMLIAALPMCLLVSSAYAVGDSVNVELRNARRAVTYRAALLADGDTVTLSGETLTATEGNEIVALVVNGGLLVLDHCTIVKTGDGIRSASRREGRDPRPEGDRERPRGERPNGGQPRGERPHGGGMGGPGGGGDDGFNFYGLNSAVVAVGEGSRIEMVGCRVTTDAEYANAVFSCDGAQIVITDGITIDTSRASSRGLFATCAGNITATGSVRVNTQGAHCAPLATDRGGGTVTVGIPGTEDKSLLNAAGEGSPCIYSTGDITVYNAEGTAQVSQTMVIEGKNSITVENCSFSGHSPKHGGIMLYQSTSGDAREGTSVLNMRDCTIRDNSGTAMILVTNTHSEVNMENCTLLDPDGNATPQKYPLVTCRNCNADGHNWGRAGNNGGQVDIRLRRQTLSGTLLARESESAITVIADPASHIADLTVAEGDGAVEINKSQ